MKILVTGNAGSGKSTLAKKIAVAQGLPCLGLDQIVWKSGWRKSSDEEIRKEISKLISNDDWVIDGVSTQIMEVADTIVFLDVPRRVSFWRAVKRNYKYLFKSRPGLPENCPEILIIPKLSKIIWRFPKRVRPKILLEQSKREDDFIHIRTANELQRYLQTL